MSDRPTKEQVRRWTDERARVRKPLPNQRELRRQLGQDLIEAQRDRKRKK